MENKETPQKLSNNNSLEAVELLGLSSSDSLDSPTFAQFQAPKPKRKVRFKKTFRSGLRSKQGRKSVSRTCNCNVVEVAKLFGYLLLLAVVGALLWYVVILSTRIQDLQDKFSDFESANRNTPEALHVIHSKLKQLDSNVTALYLEVRKNIVDIDNITSEVKLLKDVAKNIKDSIASAPAIERLPKEVNSLSESVVSFGSKINAFESSIKELKDQQSSVQTTAQGLSGELDAVKLTVQEFMNLTELQSKSSDNSSAKDLKFQSVIQETNQTIQLLQKELTNVVKSISWINSNVTQQLSVYKDVVTEVETINSGYILLVNKTDTQNEHILTLENFINSNLTLWLEQIEMMKEFPVLKNNSQNLERIVNKTLAAAIFRVINSEVFQSGNHSQINGSNYLEILKQTHDALVLLAALLRQFEQIPNTAILTDKNATDLVKALMHQTFNELLVTRDEKIELMEQELKNLTQSIQHNS